MARRPSSAIHSRSPRASGRSEPALGQLLLGEQAGLDALGQLDFLLRVEQRHLADLLQVVLDRVGGGPGDRHLGGGQVLVVVAVDERLVLGVFPGGLHRLELAVSGGGLAGPAARRAPASLAPSCRRRRRRHRLVDLQLDDHLVGVFVVFAGHEVRQVRLDVQLGDGGEVRLAVQVDSSISSSSPAASAKSGVLVRRLPSWPPASAAGAVDRAGARLPHGRGRTARTRRPRLAAARAEFWPLRCRRPAGIALAVRCLIAVNQRDRGIGALPCAVSSGRSRWIPPRRSLARRP